VSPLVLILIVGGLLLAGVGLVIWLVKRGTFEPDATNTESGQERAELTAREQSGDWTVPLRRRYKALPGPARLFVGLMLVLVIGFAALMYQILQSGRPLGAVVDVRIAAASIGVLGIVAGVRLEQWARDRVRYAYVFYEREGSEPAAERVPFMATSREFRDGSEIVKEVAGSRLFGLVWRYRQVAERRGLRESESLPEDIVEHMLPEHAWETPDGNVVIRTHAEGDKVLTGATEPDKTYSSPRQLSREEAIKLREERRRINAELSNVKATNAELMRQIRQLRKRIKNEEYHERQDLITDLGELLEQFAPLVNDHHDNQPARRPDPAEALQNGGDSE
jgi:hypothetical protein